jgi:hypothetical protein
LIALNIIISRLSFTCPDLHGTSEEVSEASDDFWITPGRLYWTEKGITKISLK